MKTGRTLAHMISRVCVYMRIYIYLCICIPARECNTIIAYKLQYFFPLLCAAYAKGRKSSTSYLFIFLMINTRRFCNVYTRAYTLSTRVPYVCIDPFALFAFKFRTKSFFFSRGSSRYYYYCDDVTEADIIWIYDGFCSMVLY